MARSERLDPGAAKALAIADAFAPPPPGQRSPAQARRDMDRQAVLLGPPEPVAESRDLTIERPDRTGLPLRIYRPSAGSELPLVLFIHGGGWMVGDIESHDGICRTIANSAEAIVVSVGYRLAPEDPFPAGLEDCLLAASWAEANSAELGGFPGGLFVAGDSAGGNLAAALCLKRQEEGRPQPAGQVLIYPALDPSCDSASHREVGEDYFITSEVIRWLWDEYADPASAQAQPLVAPLLARPAAGLAPALILTAEFDPLRDEGESYAALLEAAGVPVAVRRYDGLIHGFLTWDRHIARASEAKREIGAWIEAISSRIQGHFSA